MSEKWTRRGFIASAGAVAASSYLLDYHAAWTALASSPDEDGYELWLRYRLVDRPDLLASYRRALTHVVAPPDGGAVEGSAAAELIRGLSGLLGREFRGEPSPAGDGAVIVGTPESSPLVADLVDAGELAQLGPEGYLLQRRSVSGNDAVLVASEGERGVLYGAFHLLRLLQTYQRIDQLDVTERPANPLRVINHWDNLDRTVERGYTGRSIFQWDELPDLDERYTDYARAFASVGINGTVVNSVNANSQFLSSERLPGLAALAGVLREWGVKFHLSANFASPIQLGGLDTADPFDAQVQAWWRDKVDEIYQLIPDFGGFLAKANSEGQPGPLDYGRTHADGANMLAEAVAPHGGIIMWRSFVHEGFSDWAEFQHRVFAPLDGDFAENVVVQTKNGPIDFQVREPVNPLFGALPNTNQMIELQITQEYTGQSTHLCYLVPWWKEVLAFDTRMEGPGTTVARIVDGTAYGQTNVGFAGVVNFGDDRNWTGHHLAAANTHGWARLAWNPALGAEGIAEEWVRMTFGSHAQVVEILTRMLTSSWGIYEDYTIPLGIGGHMVSPGGAHFDPDPRASQGASHHTDGTGTGFDRTIATGTGYPALYHQHWADVYESLETVPDELLLFMHKVPYTHVLHSGKTVIQHIYDSHFDGLDDAHRLRRLWTAFGDRVDSRRHEETLERFDRQIDHATLWRDTVVGYFFESSRILDEQRAWLQVDPRRGEFLLLGGWPNRLPVEVGNATDDDLTVRGTIVPPDASWVSSSGERFIASTEFGTLNLPVVPPLMPPREVTVDIDLEPAGLETLGTTGTPFVVTPAAERCVLALDGGTANSPLVPGYNRLTPGTAWDPERGFGWVGAGPQSRDRGGAYDALRRDFCNDIPARTLRIALPGGQHDVAVLVGDADANSQPTFITVDGELVAESPFLPGGRTQLDPSRVPPFTWLHFTLDGGSAGREVDLEFDSIPDQHWRLNALVIIDPDSELAPVVLTDVELPSVMFGGRDNTVSVEVANTTAAEDVSVTARVVAPDGWVTAEGTEALSGGEFTAVEVLVTPPEDPTLSTTLQVEVTAEDHEVGGAIRDVEVIAVPHGDDVVLALDGGSATSPVVQSYQRLAPEHAWDPARGYGWVDGTPQSRDRGAALDPLRRDFCNDALAGTLRLAVPPGSHDVSLLVGDTVFSWPTFVRSEGELLAESEFMAGGAFTWLHFTLDGGSTGRDVDLELASEPNQHWHLNALVMR